MIPLVEEPVGDVEVCDDNTEVENLTEDEASQVDSIPAKQSDHETDSDKFFPLLADPLLEILDESVLSLLHILNIPAAGSFSKIFHQTTLKVQPEHSEKYSIR